MENDIKIFNLQGSPNIAMYNVLEATTLGNGASKIGVYDTDNYYTGTNVESVLKEIQENKNKVKVVIKTTDYTITSSDSLVVSNGATTITLPHATGSGVIYNIKNINASSVILDGNLSETIDGELNWTIYQWENIAVCDYTTGSWVIL